MSGEVCLCRQMSSRLPYLLSLLAALLGVLITTPAMAWVEQTVLAHDARLVLMRNGNARVQHTIRISLKGGPLRTFDIRIADKDITITGDPTFVRTGGPMDARMPVFVSAEQRPDGVLRVDIDNGVGVRRGTYELVVTYDVSLLKQNAVTRDGSLLLVTWIGPVWENGIDNVRTTFAIPSSPTNPTAVGEVTLEGPNDETVIAPLGAFFSTVTNLPAYDELELIRPHVASGESVVWKLRVDPSVLGEVHDPRLYVPAPVASTMISAERRAAYLSIGGLIAIAFSVLVTLKHYQVVRSCRIRGVLPRPFVPIGVAVRMAFAGPLLAASLGAQVFLEHPLPGSLGVLAAALLTAYRTHSKTAKPRGPGRWLPLTDEDAFGRKENWPLGWLDAGSPLGKIVFAVATIAYAVGCWQLSKHGAYLAYIAGLDFVVVAALFGTGRRSELPPDPVFSAVPLLKDVASELRKSRKISPTRICVIGRIPNGEAAPDEIRLLVRPKGSLQGFRGIEVGSGWAHGDGGPLPLPQVLLRVVDGSACHEAVNQRLRKAKWIRGRESYERVLVLDPTIPTLDMTIKLAESIALITCTAPAPQTAKVPEKTTSQNVVSQRYRSKPLPRRRDLRNTRSSDNLATVST